MGKKKGYYVYRNYGGKTYIKNPSDEQLCRVKKDPSLKEKKGALPSTLLDFLPRDILFLILLEIEPDALPSTFDITEKFLGICQNPSLQRIHKVYWNWRKHPRLVGNEIHLIVGNLKTSQYLRDLIFPLEMKIMSLPNNKAAIEHFVGSLSSSLREKVISTYETYVDVGVEVMWKDLVFRVFLRHLAFLTDTVFSYSTPYGCLEKILMDKDASLLYGKTIKDIPIALEDLTVVNLAHLSRILQISLPPEEKDVIKFFDAMKKKVGQPFVPLDLVVDSLCRLEE